jgi:LacI family transcriptional regulator
LAVRLVCCRLSRLRCEGFQARIRETYPQTEVPRVSGNVKQFTPLLARLPRPAALFCVTDNRARAAAGVAHDLGLDIPGDLALVGVDNDPYECEFSTVPLSSVVIPFETIGARAMETLLVLLRGEVPAAHTVEIPPSHVATRLSSDPLVFRDELLKRAVRLLRQPRGLALNVAGLADELGVSRRTLELRFRKAGAGTAHRLLHEVRMERAAALLRGGRLGVAEVSREIGIEDHRRFGRLFQERFGTTPGRYRRG